MCIFAPLIHDGASTHRMVDTMHFTCRWTLRPEVLSELKSSGSFDSDEWAISTTYHHDDCGRRQIKIFLRYKKLARTLTARGDGDTVEWVGVQLPNMIHHTNGHMLRNQTEFLLAMERVYCALDLVATRVHVWTDTQRLDLVMNFPVNAGEFIEMMRSVRVLGIHRWPEVFEEPISAESAVMSDPQTIQWRGKEVRLSAYNKSREQAKKSRQTCFSTNCLRVEYRLLNKQRIAKFLGGRYHASGPSIGGALPIANLEYLVLYRCYRAVLCRLPRGTVLASKCTLDNLLAACMQHGFTVDGMPVTEWYRQRVNSQTFNRRIKKITQLSLKRVTLDWKKLLPELGPPELVDVSERGELRPVFDPSWGHHLRIVRVEGGYELAEAR